MVEEIKANDEFSEVLRLHNYVQKIKGKQELVGQQATELRTMFDSLIKRTALTTNQTKEKTRKADTVKAKDGDKK